MIVGSRKHSYNENGDTMDKILLLATTDVHGCVNSHSYADSSIQGYGLARFFSAVKQYRTKNETLVVDNGDILQGTPLLTIANKTLEGKHILSQVMDEIGYAAINVGNHDFNYGQAVLERYLQDQKAPCLTSNIFFQGNPLGKSRIIITKTGKRIALIGVCTDYIPHWETPAHIRNMDFKSPLETVKSEIIRLKPFSDLRVVLYHGGLERDPFNGQSTERFTGENVGYQLALLDDIDILITGHQHRSFIAKIGSTRVVQTTFNALAFAEITIEWNIEPQIEIRIREMKNYPIDLKIEEITRTVEAKTQVWLDQSLGHVDGPSLKISDAFDARLHKHPLVSFINQVQCEASGAQLSACALFNTVTGFNPDITYRDIVSTYIYPNTLVVKLMSGFVLKEFLEKCAEYFSVNDNKIIVSPSFDEPKPQHFNYDMVDGIDYTIKVSNPISQRIVALTYQGKTIMDTDVFTIVMNNYRAVGGGDFMMVPPCETVSEVNRDMSEILAASIQKHRIYPLHHHANIKVIL